MPKITLANVEPWLIPHLQPLGEIESFEHVSVYNFEQLRETELLILGIEDMFGFSDIGAIMDMLHILAKLGSLRRVIVLSSYGIYEPKCEPYHEDDAKSPMNFVGTKAAMVEDTLIYLCNRYGLRLTVLRLFTLYGAYQRVPYVVPSMLESLAENGRVHIGDSEKQRDFLHVSDFVNLLTRVVDSEKAGLNIYNVGSGKGTTISALLELGQDVTGGSCEVMFDATKIREEYDYDCAVADIARVKADFEWEPHISLRSGLELTYQWVLGRSGRHV